MADFGQPSITTSLGFDLWKTIDLLAANEFYM
jgi:hypothetical protein